MTIKDERFEVILEDVLKEIESQDSRWGANRDKHPLAWQSILLEEVGEIAKEINDSDFDMYKLDQNYRTELIQVVAVALQTLLNYETRTK